MTGFADAIVDWGKIGELIWVSLASGVGVIGVFSLVVVGSTKSGELRRDGRGGAALAYGALAFVAGIACLAAVAYGVYLITKKS
jgi:hypothetical protein